MASVMMHSGTQPPGQPKGLRHASENGTVQVGNLAVGLFAFRFGTHDQVASGHWSCGRLLACAGVSATSGTHVPRNVLVGLPLESRSGQHFGNVYAASFGESPFRVHAAVCAPEIGS